MKDVVEVVIIGKGTNYHQKFDFPEGMMDIDNRIKVKINNQVYDVEKDGLFSYPLLRYKLRLFWKKRKFFCFFKEGKPKPIMMNTEKSVVSARLIHIVRTSKVGKNAFNKMFGSRGFSGKGILFVVVVVVAGVAAFFVLNNTYHFLGVPQIAPRFAGLIR